MEIHHWVLSGALTPLNSCAGVRIQSLAAGAEHSLAVSEAGELFSWGCGAQGRLGHGVPQRDGLAAAPGRGPASHGELPGGHPCRFSSCRPYALRCSPAGGFPLPENLYPLLSHERRKPHAVTRNPAAGTLQSSVNNALMSQPHEVSAGSASQGLQKTLSRSMCVSHAVHICVRSFLQPPPPPPFRIAAGAAGCMCQSTCRESLIV